MIRNKAREIAKSLRISEDKFKASSGWVENFKHRHGIRRGVWHGDGKASKLNAPGDPANSNPHVNDHSSEDRGAVLPPFNTSFPNRRDSHFMSDRPSNTLSPLREVQVDHNQEDYRSHMRSPLSLRPPWNASDRSPVHETSSSSRNTSDQSYSQSDTTSTSISAMSLSSLRAGWENQSPVHPLPPLPPPLHPSAYDSSHGPSNQDCTDPNVHPIQSHMGGGMYPLTSSPIPRPGSVPGRFTIQPPFPPISPSPLYRHSEPVPVNEAEDACDKVLRFVDSQPPGFITTAEREALTQIKYALFHVMTGVPREAKR